MRQKRSARMRKVHSFFTIFLDTPLKGRVYGKLEVMDDVNQQRGGYELWNTRK